MNKSANQSLLDILLQIMPSLQNIQSSLPKNDATSKSFYDIWQKIGKTDNRKFAKPATCDSGTIKTLVTAGYIEDQGKYIKITDKGAQSLKVMILNDDYFALSKKASTNKIIGWYRNLKNHDFF
jgi:DNA topoisomerase IA